MINQCSGCMIRAPLTNFGNHAMPDGGFMGCTKDRYTGPPVDLETLKAELEWCIANSPGPRTKHALEWALSVVIDIEQSNEEIKNQGMNMKLDEATFAEMRTVIDLVAAKVGGLFTCMDHGMNVSETMIDEAKLAADAAFDLSLKLTEREELERESRT